VRRPREIKDERGRARLDGARQARNGPPVAAAERALVSISRDVRDGAVITDRDLLAAYAGDESEVPSRLPSAAVRVASASDVAAVLRAASEHGVPVTARGGGTGRSGGAVPEHGGIVMLFDALGAVRGVERDDMIAVVEPGATTAAVHEAAEAHGLFYPPDPNSLASCTVGGNVATNAAGPRTFKYGVTRDWVLGMEIVTASGDILRLGKRTRKGVTGYDLVSLLVGSQGTLGIVTEVTLELALLPESIATMLALLPDEASIERVMLAATRAGSMPRCAELLDAQTLEVVRPASTVPIPSSARALLVVELDGDAALVERDLERCGNAMIEAGAIDVLVARHGGDRERLWSARREMSRSLRALARHKRSEDVVVPRTKLAALLACCRRIEEDTGIRMPAYGHAGDGNLHVNFLWDEARDYPAVERAITRLLEDTLALGGTLTGEHGLGELKAKHLSLEQSPELIALQRALKATFDPKHILNPGKILARAHGPC
jgi:glycolate oxidase